MGLLLFLGIACLTDYLYFKIKHKKRDGPPSWYFFPFLGILPFYVLPEFLFKPLFNYYLRNFPDVIVTRFPQPCVLVKNSAVQEAQMSDHCLSRSGHGLERTVAQLTTGRSTWYFADNNNNERPWQSIRKTNFMALNVLPKVQKFRKIAEVVDHLLKTIEDYDGKLWSYEDDLAFAKYQETSNVNLGRTFEANNIRSFTKFIRGSAHYSQYVMLALFIVPLELIIRFESLLPVHFRPTIAKKVYAELTRRLVEEKIADTEESRDFVEATLRIRTPEATLDFVRETLLLNMMATTHTTQHSTMATLSYISLNQRVQRKIHRELDRVVGSAHLSHEHLSSLNYLKAAIHEAYRMTPPVVVILRLTTAPVRIGGYTVEKDMKMGVSLLSETMDPRKFPNSDAFIPERHINDDGVFENSNDFSVFSRGKRSCPGMEIANLSLLIYCAKILQHFEIHPERPDTEVPRGSKNPFGVSPHIPLRFVRRAGAPIIAPQALDSGMTAFVEGIVKGELANH